MDIDKIYETLTTSGFERWYQTTFTDFVEGAEGCKTKEQIKEDIARIFKCK